MKVPSILNGVADVVIIFFYTEWCPHCKTAKPEWRDFENYINNINNTNDYQVRLLQIDCEKDKKTADKYEITGYPSVKLIYKEKIYDYDAKVTKSNLVQFLESSI